MERKTRMFVISLHPFQEVRRTETPKIESYEDFRTEAS